MDVQHTFRSLSIIDQILMTMDEADQRRHLLYRLRRQIRDDEITFEEARHTIVELEDVLEKLTAPANRVGTLLAPPKNGVAYITLGGAEYYANLDSRLDECSLKVGARVLVNEAFAVVGTMGASPLGTVGKIVTVLDDGRLQVGQEPGAQTQILLRGADLEGEVLKAGEEVRIDPNFRVALEKMCEVQEFYLEDVPELPWEKIGGQQDAIQAIQDTIEMPVLHPQLFERFQYSTPKGFLLYGPPGCGKTLIGKATAYNLEKQVQKDGLNLKASFMHIKGPEILNMWLGESERKVREIFSQAREKRREGFLPVVFIDEAESVLGTRRAIRSHNISNTVVPMFCSEMDGIDSLQDVVIILTSNRPDLIDPAILRPGRIDRKIKVLRPDEDAAREILGIYLTADLPLSEAVDDLVARAIAEIYAKRDDTRFLEVMLKSGRKEVLSRGDLCSGAILESIVQRAKEIAIKRCIALGAEGGIGFDDLLAGIETEYRENEIFPPTDNTEDWLKLLDYDPENVVRAVPIRPRRERRAYGQGVV